MAEKAPGPAAAEVLEPPKRKRGPPKGYKWDPDKLARIKAGRARRTIVTARQRAQEILANATPYKNHSDPTPLKSAEFVPAVTVEQTELYNQFLQCLPPWQLSKVCCYLALGWHPQKISDSLQLPLETVLAAQVDPVIQGKLDAFHVQSQDSLLGTLTEYGSMAAETLKNLLQSQDENIRFKASAKILDGLSTLIQAKVSRDRFKAQKDGTFPVPGASLANQLPPEIMGKLLEAGAVIQGIDLQKVEATTLRVILAQARQQKLLPDPPGLSS